jgi:NarL family two-component system response regulator LiaR
VPAFDRGGIGRETEVSVPVRVLIADDHSVVRQGLRMFLGLDPDLEVVGEAADGAEAVRMAKVLAPDVVLMDLLMPGTDGITATRQIRADAPRTEVLALTSVLEDASVVGAVQAGAVGYLLKDTQAEQLCRAIKAAARGQVQLAPEAAARLVREVRGPNSPETLTGRETDVLRALAEGKTNHLLSKLGMQSRTQAALYAVRIGLVTASELSEEP